MRQFDVYANPNNSTHRAYPFILDIQSDVIGEIATRIVVPLGRKADMNNSELSRLTPTVVYAGEEFLVLIPQIASMPAAALKHPIGSLRHLRDKIIAALDFAVAGV